MPTDAHNQGPRLSRARGQNSHKVLGSVHIRLNPVLVLYSPGQPMASKKGRGFREPDRELVHGKSGAYRGSPDPLRTADAPTVQ